MNQKVEVLSPAGNLEIFKGVVNAGADAVYFGGEKFGARAYAKNFSMEEAKEAIMYAHVHGRKAYLTVNTLLKNREIERDLYEYIKYYYEAGLDAVIVQDVSVMSFIQTYFPNLDIHASTQMTITQSSGAALLKSLGASRIVTARELSIKEIKDIYDQTGVEIETFVHGALCVSYSGQCLMSSVLGGRSGNRGRCAQPCRLPYQVIDTNGKEVKCPGPYVLSPKDLCTISNLPELIEAGVYSLKIEGRMKQLSYATGVVSMYRKYVDALLENGKDAYFVMKEDEKRIFDMGNRCGFTDTYLTKQNGRDMITFVEPSHKKSLDDGNVFVESKIPLTGYFYGHLGEPAVFTVTSETGENISVTGDVVEKAAKLPASEEIVKEKLNKTGNTPFIFEHLEVDLQGEVFLPVQKINELRRNALDQLFGQMTNTSFRKSEPFDEKSFKQLKSVDMVSNEKKDICLTVTVDTIEQLYEVVKWNQWDMLGISLELFLTEEASSNEILKQLLSQERKVMLHMPAIFRKATKEQLEKTFTKEWFLQFSQILVHSFDELGYFISIGIPKEKLRLSQRMYTFSNVARAYYEKMGITYFSAPLELNEKELSHINKEHTQLMVYGRYELMTTANCIHKNMNGCDKKSSLLYLSDRYQQRFPVKNHCRFCYNIIYNSKPTCLLYDIKRLLEDGFYDLRLDFTVENTSEVKEILDLYQQSMTKQMSSMEFPKERYTKGHLKRGVE